MVAASLTRRAPRITWESTGTGAIATAKTYVETMPMSRSALIQQLSSSAGDKFTKGQATHAADVVS
ncbi:Ltp family lipoprotein [Phycicoccus sp. M110.8]|uniref:Ltp family lipoprotein n=1 Tax=Phycicoccus sp. M110.8 TaxID=3075433 RepID=UPI003967BE07